MGTMHSNLLNVLSVSTRGDGASCVVILGRWFLWDSVRWITVFCLCRILLCIGRHGPYSTENTSRVRMRVYWPAAQHWAWRRPQKALFLLSLKTARTNHSRKHSLSTVVWRHRVPENVSSARWIATVRARITENNAPLLSRMRVYWPVT
jgi:hypothetical protein